MRYACSPAMCRSFASAPAQPPVRTPLNTYGERIGGKLPFIAMTAEEPCFLPLIQPFSPQKPNATLQL
jgi:hypothetical protein